MLDKFYREFGVFDRESGLGIESFKSISIQSKLPKDEVFSQIKSQLHSLLRFKQVLKDRDYQSLRAKIQAEKEAQADLE